MIFGRTLMNSVDSKFNSVSILNESRCFFLFKLYVNCIQQTTITTKWKIQSNILHTHTHIPRCCVNLLTKSTRKTRETPIKIAINIIALQLEFYRFCVVYSILSLVSCQGL